MLVVKIANISYERNGEEVPLFNLSVLPEVACIDARFHQLQLPVEAVEKFMNVTGAKYNDTSGERYWLPGQVPVGNITITLGNGYVTTVPRGLNG